MSPEVASVIVACVSVAGTVAAAWIANGARKASHSARESADIAAKNTAPVSNGFAGMVRDNLAQILEVATEARDAATRAEDKVDRHLEAHANAGLTHQRPPLRGL